VTVGTGVDSILARCMLDAEFLGAVSADPEGALEGYDLDERSRVDFARLDFGRVRQFAGFVTKVQHNHLWESIPFTRALLKHYGLEIEAFAAYHGTHLRLRAEGASRQEKNDSFLDFLDRYAADMAKPGLRDILRHERLELEVRQAAAALDGAEPAVSSDARSAGPFGLAVPAVRGVLRLGRFEVSPLAIASSFVDGTFGEELLDKRPHCLAYWAEPGSGKLRILEVDELTGALLEEVDGHRSVRTVVRRALRAVSAAASVAELRPIFEAAAERGLLRLGPRAETA
jgi:hypothetical protein